MKKDPLPTVSLYERRKPRQIRSTITFIMLLVVFLLATYFFNLFLQWSVIRLEVAQAPVFESPEYIFFGFSLFNQKEIATVHFFENSSRPARVFGFFDFFHPSIFHIWNKNEMAFIDLGPIVMSVPAGFSRVSFLPGSVIFVDHENKTALKYFGAFPCGWLWHGFLSKKLIGSGPASEKPLAVSFAVKELEKSRYLKIPYLIYFYLPLFMIVFLTIRYGAVLFMAFFYYVEMFFLFDFRKMFVTIPFDWIFKLINWEISAGLVEVLAVVMVFIFLIGAVFGLWHWKKDSISGLEKKIILIFILLPFCLFL